MLGLGPLDASDCCPVAKWACVLPFSFEDAEVAGIDSALADPGGLAHRLAVLAHV